MPSESAIGWFDFAVATICAWLVPRLISRQRLYHRTLRRSPIWINEKVRLIEGVEDNPKEYAEKAISKAMKHAILISVFIYTVTALVLSLLTRDIDFRTSYIVVGLSNFVGAYFVFLLSFSSPRWLGVYSSIHSTGRRIPLGASLPTLCFKVQLQVFHTFLRVYPLIIPFFLGAKPLTIPASVIIGVLLGFFLCLTIDFGNREIKDKKDMHKFGLGVAAALIWASALLFSYGCSYVEEVWGDQSPTEGDDLIVEIVTFFCWGVSGILLHVLTWKYSQTMIKSGKHEEVRRPKTFFGSSVFLSHRHIERPSRTKSIFNILSTRSVFGGSARSGGSGGAQSRMNMLSEKHVIKDEDGSADGSVLSAIKEDPSNLESSKPEMSYTAEDSSDKLAPPEIIKMDNINEEHDDENKGGIQLAGSQDVDEKGSVEENENDEPFQDDDRRGPTLVLNQREEVANIISPPASSAHNIFERTTCSYRVPNAQPEVQDNDDNILAPEDPEEEDWDMNKWHLCNLVCCDLNCGAAGKKKPLPKRAINCCRWTGWALLMGASLFFVVLLIGAQKQEDEVRSLLPFVDGILYDNMNDGEVCAFDASGDGTLREKVELTQRTFYHKDEAHLAGYSVLHCGACAACSDYNDLRQQYTTREILGQVALQCAKKVLFGGGFEKLKECTMEKTGFNDDCAACWTRDYICVKKNCIFISIRAFMINTVTNLQVGANDITPSACEEAFCEADEITVPRTGEIGFVPCSGASRRRMDIRSSIARPGDQQCKIVDVKPWEEFFGPSKGEGDYIEDWNATTLRNNATVG